MNLIPALYFLFTIAVCSYFFYQVTEKEKLSKIRKIIYWIIIIGMSLALYPVGAILGSLTADGNLIDVHFYNGPAGDLVITNSDVEMGTGNKQSSSDRLQSIDLKTGKIVGKVPSFAFVTYITTNDDKIWSYNDFDGLNARTPDTLKMLITEDEIIAKNPELKNGLVDGTYSINPKTHQIVVTTKVGYNFEIDNKTFVVNPVTKAQLATMNNFDISMDTDSKDYKEEEVILANKQHLSIDGSARSAIQNETNRTTPLFPNSDLTFLAGGFLIDTVKGKPVELDSPPSIMMIEKQAIDGNEPSIISRVSLTGKVLWKQQLFDANSEDYVHEVHLDGDNLIIVTDYEVLALDSSTGAIKWTDKF